MSKPFNYFNQSIARAVILLDLADDQDDANDDLYRAATVLAVAAYDHYFTSKFCDVLASYLSKNEPNKELLEQLSRAGLNAKTALEIAVMKRPFRRIRSLLTKALSEVTTHRTKAIDNLFSGIDLKGLSGRVVKANGKKTLTRRIDRLVDIRNEIVHAAHIDTHGKAKHINAKDIRARIACITEFVSGSETIINDWVKTTKLPNVTSKM